MEMLPVAAGIFGVVLIGDIVGRAVILTSAVLIRQAARLAWWTGSACLTTATRMAAQYLETQVDAETHKLLSWSENENRIVINRESPAESARLQR